jgi:hypothetical protein
MQLNAWHLPDGIDTGEIVAIAECDGITVRAPSLTPDAVRDTCEKLIQARARLLELPVSRVIDVIDAAARRLSDPSAGIRSDLIRALAAVTGYSTPMAALVLDRMSEDWRAPALHRLLAAELGGADAIDGFTHRAAGSRSRAVGATLGLHVFAGNVPGVSVTSIVRALLVRSAVLGKTAAGEPVLAPAFARLLAEEDPTVGACVAVTYWQGGDLDLEAAALEKARLVIHYGSAEAVASLQRRAPAGTRFVEHGPRVSCAVILAPAADADADPDGSADSTIDHPTAAATRGDHLAVGKVRGTAAADFLRSAAVDTARAVALFDQQGCVSPQFVCVIGSAAHARAFASHLAAALRAIQAELPRGRLDAAEAAAARDLQTRAEFRAIAGEAVDMWQGDNLAFTVIRDPVPSFTGSCLNRTVTVYHVPAIDELLARLAPFGPWLQTVGIAGFQRAQAEAFTARVAELGATRVTPVRSMPWPPVTWHHDGAGPLRELVQWIDLEEQD